MSKQIFIDAVYPQETRVVITDSGIMQDLYCQNNSKKSIKGNIYLAKVTRVEPSLQAAFVDYGNERQGFLPFSEIHPDYYQIPSADKEKLLQQLDAQTSEVQEEDEALAEGDNISLKEEDEITHAAKIKFSQQYKIQEVIKKDQIILVQVIKEERGNKGAAFTTWVSLAGRYCVLMPGVNSGGGVSRKVEDRPERKRLQSIAAELIGKATSSVSIIIRTAGAYKSKPDIKRDFMYLIKLWDNIRSHTMAAQAPAFIYEEGDVLTKTIRDIYSNEISDVVVSGEEVYQKVSNLVKVLSPKHAAKVILHQSLMPIFSAYHNLESQVAGLYNPVVNLPSGGYLVISETEALVAIDVNSGKANKERHIEATALKTNLEAAVEIAKQLRLRDLAGLIVIDFIDMSESKNRRSVESTLNNGLSKDRARTQCGKISTFGLLEMSRQRINQSFSESNMKICTQCDGTGKVRPLHASAIAVLRAIRNEASISQSSALQVAASAQLLIYMLNNNKGDLLELEKITGYAISFVIDEEAGVDGFFIEQIKNDAVVKSPTKPLSSVELPAYEVEEEQEEEEVVERNIRPKSKQRRGKKNWKAPAADVAVEQNEISPLGHESELAVMPADAKSKKYRRRGRGRKPDIAPQVHGIASDDAVLHSNSDDDMDSTTQQTVPSAKSQSFLREIWNKLK